MVMACAGALWLVARFVGTQYTRSALVGAMLGPLAAVGGSGPLRLVLAGRDGPGSWIDVALVVANLLVGAGLAGAHVAKRPRDPRPASAALTWTGASLLLAGLARTLHAGAAGAGWVALLSMPIGAALAGAGLLGVSPRRPRPPQASFNRLLLALMFAVAAGPFWPWLLPWLLVDRNLPEVGPWPPNLLFVALEVGDEPLNGVLGPHPVPTLELIAARGVSYARLAPEPAVQSLLALPDGSYLALQLQAAGYATGAVLSVPDPSLTSVMVTEQTDDRPGGLQLLEESAGWMAGSPLLLGPASPLLSVVGQDRALRSPEQVVADAARWILSWRATRAPAPFFLMVDLRAPGAGAEAVDAGLQTLLARLDELQLDQVTILIVAVEGRASVASDPSLRGLVAPPFTWSGVTRQEVAPAVWGRELSLALLRIALSDGETPVSLPGLAQPLSPTKPLRRQP
jgi:hypothetical protein